jgi:hypothetical protein
MPPLNFGESTIYNLEQIAHGEQIPAFIWGCVRAFVLDRQSNETAITSRMLENVYIHERNNERKKFSLETQVNTFVAIFYDLGDFMQRCLQALVGKEFDSEEIEYRYRHQPLCHGRHGVGRYDTDENPVTLEFIIKAQDVNVAMCLVYFQNSGSFKVECIGLTAAVDPWDYVKWRRIMGF